MAGPADFTLILRALWSHDVEFIVVGGVSAVLNGAPISTFDLDIVHKRSPDNVARLKTTLAELTDAGPLDVLGALGNLVYEDLLGDTTKFSLENEIEVHVLNLARLRLPDKRKNGLILQSPLQP